MAFTHKTRVQFPAGEHFFSLFFSSSLFFVLFSYFSSFVFFFFFSFLFMHCVGVITLVTRSIDRPHHSAYTPRIHRPIDRSIDSFDPPSPRPSPLSPQLEHDEKKKREEEPREAKREVLPGLEPGSSGSEPEVLTNYTIEPLGRCKQQKNMPRPWIEHGTFRSSV